MHHDTATDHDARSGDEHGQAMVEFALVLPILCLILFGMLEFGTAFWHYQQLSAAASEGARKAAVSRSAPNRTTLIRDAAVNASPGLQTSSIGVTSASTWTAGDTVTVTVTYPERISVMGIDFFNANLTSRRTARVEH